MSELLGSLFGPSAADRTRTKLFTLYQSMIIVSLMQLLTGLKLRITLTLARLVEKNTIYFIKSVGDQFGNSIKK